MTSVRRQLVQSSDSTLLGLQFLLTAAEELVAPREDLSCARRTELRQLLLREVPATLAVLTGELQLSPRKMRETCVR